MEQDCYVQGGNLQVLSRLAIFAVISRYLRRVQPVYALAFHHPEDAANVAAIEEAIQLAEDHASGVDNESSKLNMPQVSDRVNAAARKAERARQAAESAGHDSQDFLHARCIAEAAALVVSAVRSPDIISTIEGAAMNCATIRNGMDQDLALNEMYKLKSQTRESYPEHGPPIDPGEDGPLGVLWPHGEPDWYSHGIRLTERLLEHPDADAKAI